jgi:hypothetical protein
MAVQEDKVMEDFELESLQMEGDHSQKVKAHPSEAIIGGFCKTPFGAKSALLTSDSNFSQIAYGQ